MFTLLKPGSSEFIFLIERTSGVLAQSLHHITNRKPSPQLELATDLCDILWPKTVVAYSSGRRIRIRTAVN